MGLNIKDPETYEFAKELSELTGESMTTALDPKIAKAAFGIVPPDLSLAARSRSVDWLYTYLRSFYRDPASKSGSVTNCTSVTRRLCCVTLNDRIPSCSRST